ncbi:MAG: RNA polymerase sigma factor [Bacteroidales bacterium]
MKFTLGIRKYTTEELVQGCLENKREFQRMLYDQYAPAMYGICLQYAGNRNQAKDILQDVFIKIFRNLHQFEGKGSLEGWIRRVITNTAIDHFKTKKRIHFIPGEETQTEKGYVEEDIISQLQTSHLLECVSRLPEGARIIFNLHTLEGYNHQEISEKLNISVGTSKSQLNRAKTLLKKWISAELK